MAWLSITPVNVTPYLLRYILNLASATANVASNITNHGGASPDLTTDSYPTGPLHAALVGLQSNGIAEDAWAAIMQNKQLRVTFEAQDSVTSFGAFGINDSGFAGLAVYGTSVGAALGTLTIEYRHTIEQ
jgi:hypothetical protein